MHRQDAMVQAIHTTVPGRARFRVEGLYRSETLKRLLEFRLARNIEISHVSASVLTGNVLVCFNSGNTPQTIESLIAGIVQEHHNHLENRTLLATPGKEGSSVIQGVASPLDAIRGYFFGPEDQPQEHWHLLEADEVLSRYKASKDSGLSSSAAQENLRKFGANVLPESQPRSAWEIFYQQFNSAVPEGLPAAATTTLALGVRDMQRHQVLIRRLNAVETLGAVEVVCLDKTGTITHNHMSVVQVFSGMEVVKVAAGKFWAPEGLVSLADHKELARLLEVSVLCNETEVYWQDGQYSLRGTPTECALVDLAIQAGIDVEALKQRFPLVKMNYRSEDRPFMGSFHGHPSKGKLLAIKGSPLEVLAMCDRHLRDGRKLRLKEEDRMEIEAQNAHMAGEAQRVLGLAYAEGKNFQNGNPPEGLVWLGMIGMADPVREGVKGALAAFHRAGIKTMMITGDQSPTAYAIGMELNLSQGAPLEILDCTHLADIDPETLQALANRAQVFARVSPAHKLEIVQVLQKSGKVIAMTGDGINDGPALKAADVGIAMGDAGTDIAREVADVVLEEDNLDTLIIAIRDGRTIYLNIRKSVHFFLATNFSELLLTFAALAVGLGSPLTAMQLLCINLISDIFPGLALAMEAPEPDILQQPPRNPHRPIFTSSDYKRMGLEAAVLSAGALGAYGYGIMRYGMGAQASTLAFHSLTSGQLLHAISCRSETHSIFSQGKLPPNKYLRWALGGSLLLQIGAMFMPGLRTILGLAPVGLLDGLVIGSTALLPLVVNEATKTPATPGEEPPLQALPDAQLA